MGDKKRKIQNMLILAGMCLGIAAVDSRAFFKAAERRGFETESQAAFPVRWDSREYAPAPVVKAQGAYGTCWALAATTALEGTVSYTGSPDVHLAGTAAEADRVADAPSGTAAEAGSAADAPSGTAAEADNLADTPAVTAADAVFSADHLAIRNGFESELDEGGDYSMIMAYLSSWLGPVWETQDPYGDAVSPEGLESVVHVQEILEFREEDLTDGLRNSVEEEGIETVQSTAINEVKSAICRYGYLQTNLYMDRKLTGKNSPFYQPEYAAYYYPEEREPIHDIVLLGWDDTFSRDYFQTDPGIDGAWLCQNSWGDSFGEEGLFYVSYADANICRDILAYARVEGTENYSLLQQADEHGWQAQLGYQTETCWMANVYQIPDEDRSGESGQIPDEDRSGESDRTPKEGQAAEADRIADGNQSEEAGQIADENQPAETDRITDPENEMQLCAAGFYTLGRDSEYEIWLVREYEDSDSLKERIFLQEGTLEQAGFHTVDLDVPVSLARGETYALLVRLTTPGILRPAAVEYAGEHSAFRIRLEGKQSFLSETGEFWENTQERHACNVCLKAYLRDGDE